jgi:ubiquinone biosynthesis protein COQ9
MDEPASPLERARRDLALATGEHAVFDGWSRKAVEAAAAEKGVDRAKALLAMPKGNAELIDLYVQAVDRALEKQLPEKKLVKLKIRERIRTLIWTRLEIMGPAREAVRSALSILAMPQNLPLAARIGWRSADMMWRLAGDTATDFNHYTKRMTLGAVYGSTLLVWLDDASEGGADTQAFLDRRIDDVMRFEKWKAGWKGAGDRRLSPTRFLGRLRYPPR